MLSRILLSIAMAVAPLAAAESPVDGAWKALVALEGEWSGHEGKSGITYTVVSNGNAVLERMKMPAPAPDMVTVYHRDGAGLMATHYCAVGNQPRMRATAGDAKTISFRFVDITNLSKPTATHIHDLTVTFQDKDNFTQEWTALSDGKPSVQKFVWTRKK